MGVLPHEGVGAKKFGMSLETWEIKFVWRAIPGFCWDVPEVPEKFENKKCLCSIFGPYKLRQKLGKDNHGNSLSAPKLRSTGFLVVYSLVGCLALLAAVLVTARALTRGALQIGFKDDAGSVAYELPHDKPYPLN